MQVSSAGATVPGSLGHKNDAREVYQHVTAGVKLRKSRRHVGRKIPQLRPSQRREQVAHAVVLAQLAVLVVWCRI